MTSEQRENCGAIIHVAASAAATAAAGLAQLPIADSAVLVPIEMAMVISLGKVFKISLDESGAKSVLAGFVGTMIGRGISQLLVGWIPFVGNLVNAATAAAVVEGLGWAVAEDFDNGANRYLKN